MNTKAKIIYSKENQAMSLVIENVGEESKAQAREYLNNLSIIGSTVGPENTKELKDFFQNNPRLAEYLPRIVNFDGSINHTVLGELIDQGIIKT